MLPSAESFDFCTIAYETNTEMEHYSETTVSFPIQRSSVNIQDQRDVETDGNTGPVSVKIQGQTAKGYVVASPSDDDNVRSGVQNEKLKSQGCTEGYLKFNDLENELYKIAASMGGPVKRLKNDLPSHSNELCKLHRTNQTVAKGWDPLGRIPEILMLKMVEVITSLDAVKYLLFRPDYEGDTKLHLVIIYGLEEVALTIIDSVVDYELLGIQNQMYQTPLHLAVTLNIPNVARRLMCCGVEVDACDHNGNTPLHIACRDGNINMAKLLLTPIKYEEVVKNKSSIQYRKIPQDLNIRNFEGDTCMDIVFRSNNKQLIQLLFEKGAEVDQRCLKTGRTLLYRACINGNIELVKYLIQKNCDINACAYDGSTPFDAARSNERWQIVAILAERGAESDSDEE